MLMKISKRYTNDKTWSKVNKLKDDVDLTLKFVKYLKHRTFNITMTKADFRREKGKDYFEYIKDLVKDIELE